MQRAKAFLYVCVGIFLLALAYHLGAASATAQSGTIDAAGTEGSDFNAVVGRVLYTSDGDGGTRVARPPIPGSDPVIAVNGAPNGNTAMLANGDCYRFIVSGSPNGWLYQGNVFGTATPARQSTFGAVKARYR